MDFFKLNIDISFTYTVDRGKIKQKFFEQI